MHERQTSEHAAFVTLTYDDKHLPEDRQLDPDHLKNFLKRYRKNTAPIRYLASAEYGPKKGRPHFHLLMFSEFPLFPDRKFWKNGKKGHAYFNSETLDRTWHDQGYGVIGDVTLDSAQYVARYILGKQKSRPENPDYTKGPIPKRQLATHHLNPQTGELTRSEFNRMSTNPGMGSAWFHKYWQDIYPNDTCLLDGTIHQPPRYYDKLLDRINPSLLETVKEKRQKKLDNVSDYDKSHSRLKARNQLLKLQNIQRDLERVIQ